MSELDVSRIMIEASRMTLQMLASLTDDSRGIIYDHNMLIKQATGDILWMSVKDVSRIIIEATGMMLQIVASLTDNSRGIIYDNMFIKQASGDISWMSVNDASRDAPHSLTTLEASFLIVICS